RRIGHQPVGVAVRLVGCQLFSHYLEQIQSWYISGWSTASAVHFRVAYESGFSRRGNGTLTSAAKASSFFCGLGMHAWRRAPPIAGYGNSGTALMLRINN